MGDHLASKLASSALLSLLGLRARTKLAFQLCCVLAFFLNALYILLPNISLQIASSVYSFKYRSLAKGSIPEIIVVAVERLLI
jgi:hypothetical protein